MSRFCQSSFKIQLGYLSPKVKIDMIFESLLPIMTECIKNQQTKKHLFLSHQTHAKNIKRSIKSVAQSCSLNNVILKIYQKFTGKRMYRSLFFIEVADLKHVTLFQKRLQQMWFRVNLTKLLWTPISKNTWERLFLETEAQ